jgi:hypothetical protein
MIESKKVLIGMTNCTGFLKIEIQPTSPESKAGKA